MIALSATGHQVVLEGDGETSEFEEKSARLQNDSNLRYTERMNQCTGRHRDGTNKLARGRKYVVFDEKAVVTRRKTTKG